MDFGDQADNPFAAPFRGPKTPRKQALQSALRFFVIVGICLAVTLMITSNGKGWLVQRVMRDFDSLQSDEKKERLGQVAELGLAAIPALANSLADGDIEVARTAYELLGRAQNSWTVLEQPDRTARHRTLVESLQKMAVRLPDDRTGWGTSLLQQTLVASVSRADKEGRELYLSANHAMDLLALSDRVGARAVSESELDSIDLVELGANSVDQNLPRRLEIRAKPLPVSRSPAADLWTEWPPTSELRFADSAKAVTESESVNRPSSAAGSNLAANSNLAAGEGVGVSVYRSGSKQQREPVDIERDEASQNSADAAMGNNEPIAQVTHLVESPLQTFDDQSVMRWLGSENPQLRNNATSELKSRGYGETDLAIATQIVTGDARAKLDLTDALADSSNLDPRPWLLMLLDDPSRDVKLRVVSVLATMNDPSISQRLRLRLVDERDPTVAARIRRVLKLR